MKQPVWEYKVVSWTTETRDEMNHPSETLEKALLHEGEEGWELVQILCSSGSILSGRLVFKRPKPEAE